MPSLGSLVKYRYGTLSEYEALTTPNQNTVYFITDKRLIVLGDQVYSGAPTMLKYIGHFEEEANIPASSELYDSSLDKTNYACTVGDSYQLYILDTSANDPQWQLVSQVTLESLADLLVTRLVVENDTVATYADLEDYDTTSLESGFIVRVVTDEEHDNKTTYYEWDGTNWVYLGTLFDDEHIPTTNAVKGYVESKTSSVAPGEPGGVILLDENGKIDMNNLPFGIDDTLSDSSTNPVQNRVITSALADKVDVDGSKGLSTNDFTDKCEAKLQNIVGTGRYSQADWLDNVEVSPSYIKNKPEILTNFDDSSKINDNNLISAALGNTINDNVVGLNADVNGEFVEKHISDGELTYYILQYVPNIDTLEVSVDNVLKSLNTDYTYDNDPESQTYNTITFLTGHIPAVDSVIKISYSTSSQGLVNTKIDKTAIVQTTGTNTDSIMSQNAVTNALDNKVDKEHVDPSDPSSEYKVLSTNDFTDEDQSNLINGTERLNLNNLSKQYLPKVNPDWNSGVFSSTYTPTPPEDTSQTNYEVALTEGIGDTFESEELSAIQNTLSYVPIDGTLSVFMGESADSLALTTDYIYYSATNSIEFSSVPAYAVAQYVYQDVSSLVVKVNNYTLDNGYTYDSEDNIILISKTDVSFTDSYNGDGTEATYGLSRQPTNSVTVTVSGVPQILGTDYTYDNDPISPTYNSIIFLSGHTPVNDSVIEVVYPTNIFDLITSISDPFIADGQTTTNYVLSQTPLNNTINQVTINNSVTTAYTYDSTTNSITFTNPPTLGTTIRITYDVNAVNSVLITYKTRMSIDNRPDVDLTHVLTTDNIEKSIVSTSENPVQSQVLYNQLLYKTATLLYEDTVGSISSNTYILTPPTPPLYTIENLVSFIGGYYLVVNVKLDNNNTIDCQIIFKNIDPGVSGVLKGSAVMSNFNASSEVYLVDAELNTSDSGTNLTAGIYRALGSTNLSSITFKLYGLGLEG